jgi:simple sugar transport system permease protein
MRVLGRTVDFEPRGVVSLWFRVLVAVIAIVGAGLAGAVLLVVTGHPPVEAYRAILRSGFGDSYGWVRTLLSATPLIFTALAAAVSFRMKVWNIGGEGQFYLGAIAGSGIALAFEHTLPDAITLILALVGGALAGGLWASIAAVPKAYLGTDEVISTLMLNFIALHLMGYLIFGSVSFWRERSNLGFPSGRQMTVQLPLFFQRLHVGFLVALALALLCWWFLRSSRWGFDIRVIGDSPRAARFAGMRVTARLVWTLVLSGAIAGLGGAVHATGVTLALNPSGIAVGFGYTGIVVAAVAGLDPIAIVAVAILISGLSNASTALQILEVPNDIVVLLQGLTLLLVAATEFFLRNRMRVVTIEQPERATEVAV